jgi:hypothetical protein
MYSRVLFATDLSEASDLALDCVAGWKSLGLSGATNSLRGSQPNGATRRRRPG